jgi:hypothetical protein
MLEKVEVR